MTKSAFAAAVLLAACSAQAAVVTGTLNSHGYDVQSFTVPAAGTVNFDFIGGINDSMISLFSSTGAHIVSNDDANFSLDFNLFRSLSAGSYTALVSYCCTALTPVLAGGASFSFGPGFSGLWSGGSATLGSVTTYLDNFTPSAAGSQYSMNVVNANAVPEPAGYALAGLGLLGVALSSRRKA